MLQVTEGLEHFVMQAHEDGAISGRETDSILHPLRSKISACLKTIGLLDRGILTAVGRQVPNTESDKRIVLPGSASDNTSDKAIGQTVQSNAAPSDFNGVLPGTVGVDKSPDSRKFL